MISLGIDVSTWLTLRAIDGLEPLKVLEEFDLCVVLKVFDEMLNLMVITIMC